MENNNSQIDDKTTLPKSKFAKSMEGFWDLIKFAVIALLIVIPIRMFIAQPFVVSGDSMFPTFHNGEYLIVNEISYLVGLPHRGEVVIFRYPLDTKRYFIKRIIGLPNEDISISNGTITIYNKANPNGFSLTEPYIDESFNTTAHYKTGPDEYFVMGDNRNRSSDSRIWGVVPGKLLIGKAFLRLYPFSSLSYLPGFYKEIK